MAENVEYRIKLLSSQFNSSIDKINGKVDKLERNIKGAQSSTDKLSGGFKRVGAAMLAAFAVDRIISFGSEVINLTADFEGLENAITFASRSTEEGQKNLNFLRESSDRLGTDLNASMEGFKTLSAAMMGSSLEGEETRKIFESVSVASSAMNLTADQSKGAFLALGQMMGKGKVSAEELRGQLGERIPGAFQVAARAMGVTTAELDKMLVNGELMSEDFLPKFAKELKATFSGALGESTDSLRANLNRMNNEWMLLKVTLGTKLKPVVIAVSKAFIDIIDFLKEHQETIKVFGKALIAITTGFALYTLAIKGATIATAALNFVMSLNPIGAIIVALAALVTAIVMAYRKVDWFRGAIDGLWSAMKNLGLQIHRFIIDHFQGLVDAIMAAGKAMKNVVKGDFKQAAKEAKGIMEGLTRPKFDFGKVAEEFKKGYKKGFDEVNKEKSIKIDIAGRAEFDKMLTRDLQKHGIVAKTPQTPKANELNSQTNKIQNQRPTTVNLNIQSLVENLSFNTQSFRESANVTKQEITKVLLEALRDTTVLIGN